MELTASSLRKDPELNNIAGRINSSGEAEWTVETAMELGVPAPVVAISLMTRYRSQSENSFAAKLVAALRYEFGGHTVSSTIDTE